MIFVLSARLRHAVQNGFDVVLGVERSQTCLQVSHFTRNALSLKRFSFKLAIGNSESEGYLRVWGLFDKRISGTTRAER